MEFVKKILDTTLAEYCSKCPSNITDLVFIEIEKNYMAEYNIACNSFSNDVINKKIGKLIREYWHLKNLGRCFSHKSKLIRSYEMHSN